MSALAPAGPTDRPRSRSTRAAAGIAFWQILARDVFVTTRELPSFVAQVVVQPFFLVFVFGRLLGDLGFAQRGYADLLLPGVIALTVVLTALQSTALPLVIEFSYTREIEDRLLAPLPISLVAIEKIVFAALRGLISGAVMFPIGLLVLGHLPFVLGRFWMVIGFGILGALVGGAMGLTLGTMVPVNRINIMFALILTPLLFTGCSQYPWPALGGLRWFQALTTLNPLTYVSEGFRSGMIPSVPHMNSAVAAAVLVFAVLLFTVAGLHGFRRRALE
jgi:ABC-2 type transport system permease protein